MVDVVDELIAVAESRGITVEEECMAIALAAVDLLGLKYGIGVDLTEDAIDCSTLTSQAHWIGGAVQIPFTAKGQERAPAARRIDDVDAWLPGDVLVPSRSTSEARHVAMFVGWRVTGETVVAESVGGSGSRLVSVKADSFQSVLRFSHRPRQRFKPGAWNLAAKRVPKAGRLGARLTEGSGRHTGVDIVWRGGCTVVAPADGLVRSVYSCGNRRDILGSELVTPTFRTKLSPLEAVCVQPGAVVRSGDPLGILATAGSSECNRRVASSLAWLHLELWHQSDGLPFPSTAWSDSDSTAGEGLNPIYALKIGLLSFPFALVTQAAQ